MKTLFRQCRVCPQDKSCAFRDETREELRDVALGMTGLISCPEYRGLFKAGDRVKVEVLDMDDTEDAGIEGGYRVNCPPYYEQKGDVVKGTITGVIQRSKLFQVKLDKPVTLNRLNGSNKLEEVTLEFYTKTANKIRRI